MGSGSDERKVTNCKIKRSQTETAALKLNSATAKMLNMHVWEGLAVALLISVIDSS